MGLVGFSIEEYVRPRGLLLEKYRNPFITYDRYGRLVIGAGIVYVPYVGEPGHIGNPGLEGPAGPIGFYEGIYADANGEARIDENNYGHVIITTTGGPALLQ